MNCPWCGYGNMPDSRYCGECGRGLLHDVVCDSCGVGNPGEARYCDSCGRSLLKPDGNASAIPPEQAGTPPTINGVVRPLVASVSAALAAVGRNALPASLMLRSSKLSATTVALAIVLGIAAIVRLVNLTDTPPNVTADEADNLQVVYRVLAGKGPGFFGLDWKPAPAFSTYLMAGFMRIFGESIVGMRMASVVLSVISLAVFYVMARESLSRFSSLASTFLLGTGLWYLHFSRSGWENIHVALYALLAALTLTRAVKRGSWRMYAAGGIFAALGLYGYTTGTTIIVAILLYLPVALLLHRSNRKRILLGFGLLTVVCLALFSPQIETALDDWEYYNRRTESVSILNLQDGYRGDSGLFRILAHQVWRSVDSFFLMDSGMSRSGMNARYIPHGWAVLDRITGVLFWLGLLASVRHLRQTALWWTMLVVMLLPVQVLSAGTPDAARAVGVAPFFYLFAGLGLESILNLSARWRAPLRAVAVPVLVAIAFINVSGYFHWMDQPYVGEVRQPAVEVEEFDRWQALQIAEAEAGKGGFNVLQWHEMRESAGP